MCSCSSPPPQFLRHRRPKSPFRARRKQPLPLETRAVGEWDEVQAWAQERLGLVFLVRGKEKIRAGAVSASLHQSTFTITYSSWLMPALTLRNSTRIRTNDAELNRVEFGKVYLVDSLGGTRLDLVGKSDCAGLIDQNLFH
jgi:hypothetical protein